MPRKGTNFVKEKEWAQTAAEIGADRHPEACRLRSESREDMLDTLYFGATS